MAFSDAHVLWSPKLPPLRGPLDLNEVRRTKGRESDMLMAKQKADGPQSS